MKRNFCFLLLTLLSGSVLAQIDSGQDDYSEVLKTVYLTDSKLEDFSVGQTLHTFKDSVLIRNQSLLTSLLEYNTPIYFKENGLGMVSSPSFRGTTASQTAVIWNGVNINSSFLGQTDFNTITTGIFDQISVRAGGGSLIYGSGAIGGSVHLNTELDFSDKFRNDLYVGYGSFNTLDTRYKLAFSTNQFSLRIGVSHNQSDNDYKFKTREGKNTNGQYNNTGVNLAFGYKINSKNQLNLYTEGYDGDRHFPIYYKTETKTKYRDLDLRNMLEWESRFNKFISSLKGVYLREKYKYFENIEKPEFSFGRAESFIGNYSLSYHLQNSLLVSALLSHEHTEGKGTNVLEDKRDISSVGLLLKHQPNQKLKYQAGIRKEITNAYGSPVLFSLGAEYAFLDFYSAKLAASTNYRRPTFNDLYWNGSGNPDLLAEKSKQIEFGNRFTLDQWQLNLTGYYNDIQDMIHWLPGSGGIFYPKNEDHVKTYGLEAVLNRRIEFGEHQIQLDGTYAYTASKNQKTHKQLIYVPYHKATFSAVYSWKDWDLDYQFLYNGSVYMRSDNDPKQVLGGYGISNIGVSYSLGKSYWIGSRVRNLFDKSYENVKRYELPGINYSLYITLNF